MNVIGLRMRDPKSGRLVAMEEFAPTIATYVIGAGYAKPAKKQLAKIVKWWNANPDAPNAIEWVEGSEPDLTIAKPSIQQPTPNAEETE